MKHNVYMNVFVEMFENFYKGVRQDLGKIAVLLQIAFPLLVCVSDATMLQKALMVCAWVFIVSYLRKLDMRLNRRSDGGFPMPPCKLTKVDRNGFVEVVEGKTEAAIIYLSDVEEYLEKMKKYY